MSKFVPKVSDIAWLQNCISVIRDGGVWGIPMTQQIVTVDHTNKQLIFTNGGDEEMIRRTRACAEKMQPPYEVIVPGSN